MGDNLVEETLNDAIIREIMMKKIKNIIPVVSKFIKQNKNLLMILLFCSVIIDALLISTKSDVITFLILGLYIILINAGKIKSKTTFIFCLILLFVMYINFLISGPEIKAEKSAVWLVLFMLVGIIQQWRE